MVLGNWDEARADYTLAIRSSIALFEAHGVITRKSATEALRRFYEAYAQDKSRLDVSGTVVMYDRCEMQLSLFDMLAVYQDIGANGLPIQTVPLALVVPEWIYGVAKEYCGMQREAGVIREAFLCRDEALEWIEKQVALMALQRRTRNA